MTAAGSEASLGMAVSPEHGDDVDVLLQRADVAMYAAKTAGTRVDVYRADTDPYSPERLGLLSELRRAIDRAFGSEVTAQERALWVLASRGRLDRRALPPAVARRCLRLPIMRHRETGVVRS